MKRSPRILPYLLIAPTFLFVAVFTLYPLCTSVAGSFFRQKLQVPKYREPVWTGFGNYIRLFSSPDFRLVLLNTVIYVAVSVVLIMLLSFTLALLLSGKFKGQTFFRLLVFHPAVLPMVSAATLWMFFFTPDYGILNQVLHLFGYVGPQNWTSNPMLALPSIILVDVWKESPFYMIFILAGLQTMDPSVLEAARMDGASGPVLLFRIIIPLIRRSLVFTNIVVFISTFQTIDHIFILTGGGPSNHSNILLYRLWQLRFEQLDIGDAQAVTVILVAVLLAFTTARIFTGERNED